EIIPLDGRTLTSTGVGGRMTIKATDSPFPNVPSLLYVLVKSGSHYALGQFAITGVDADGDGLSDSYETAAGIPAAHRGSLRAAHDLFEMFDKNQPGSIPQNSQVDYAV